jgi:hypothetical protein
MNCNTLREYLDRYGALMAERARQAFEPLHVPATDAVVTLDLKRPMLPARAHVVTAAKKAAEANLIVRRDQPPVGARRRPCAAKPTRPPNLLSSPAR